ncbi:hypothetical protein AAP_06231 [Ascosphaera apis ARSEF 7405]|uniref:Uncharacterized protein n=1 Tax=Ascosphaera apis ARSEF 7405 TaxID=392613 RepID=A0A167UY43_9EURO|nr:hypothetical protein AAP_06231 [Ascosphaera apis ARSEF 7405]
MTSLGKPTTGGHHDVTKGFSNDYGKKGKGRGDKKYLDSVAIAATVTVTVALTFALHHFFSAKGEKGERSRQVYQTLNPAPTQSASIEKFHCRRLSPALFWGTARARAKGKKGQKQGEAAASTISAGTEPKRQGPITHLPSNPPSCAVSETTSIASPKSTPHSPRPESPSQAPISIDNAATTATTASTDDSHQPPSVFSSHIIVRDFAYADTHPLHHGPPPANSSASNRNTDDDKIDGTERGDTEGSRPAPDWNPDAMYDNTLPPTSYGDGSA